MKFRDFINKLFYVKKRHEEKIKFPKASHTHYNSEVYNLYKEEEKLHSLPKTMYEKLCNISKSILTIEPDDKTRVKLEQAIKITNLNTTPEGTTSLVVLSGLIFGLIVMIGMALKMFMGRGITLGNGFVLILMSLIFSIYMYLYPIHLEKIYKVKLKSQIVRMFVYMSIYLRSYPNVEGAILFAAQNSPEPLAYILRKMLWDVEVGKYKNMEDAINNFLKYWKDDKAVVETMQILISSTQLTKEKRLETIDRAISTIMEGARDEAKSFNLKMRMPITAIYALGILLPMMGMVMVPIMVIFLSDYFKPASMFITYDIILPIALLFVVTNVIDRRPIAFAPTSIENNPDVPPKGKFRIKIGAVKVFINSMIPAILIGLPIIYIGYKLYTNPNIDDLWPSILMIVGLSAAIYTYNKLMAFQRIKIREQIKNIEAELPESLYKISNFIERGKPIEVSLEESLKDIGELKINKMYQRIIENIKFRGMTFEGAIKNEKYGAIKFFPSNLISSTLRILIQSSKKGVKSVASTMRKISTYLKYTKEVQDNIMEMMSEVTSSIKFQAIILTPVLTAVITSMSNLVIKILNRISSLMSSTDLGTGSMPFGNVNITPGQFQLAVGLYMIESTILLIWFNNQIENSGDEVSRYNDTASTILISTIIYIIVFTVSWFTFGRFTPQI